MKVSVVITCYNALRQTTRCLDAVLRESGQSIERLVVVDDGSDPPFEHAETNRLTIVRNAANLGYVASVNRGFREIDSDVVVLLDCDAYVIGDIVSTAGRLFEADEKLGLAGFTLENERGQPTGSSDAEPTVWSLVLGQKIYAHAQPWLVRNGAQVYFSCAIAVRRACFEELGGFDPRFDFLDADIDFSMRVNRSRWKSQVGEGLRAIHQGGGSPQSTAKRVVRYHVNRYRLLEKHGGLWHPRLVRLGVLARAGIEYAALNSLLIWDRSEARAQQRTSRRMIIAHFCRGQGKMLPDMSSNG